MKKQDSGNHRMGNINRTVNRMLAGLSIVELMVALTLLAIVSIAGLQIMQMSQSSFSAGRSSLATQQKNQAIASFINQDFGAGILPETGSPRPYVNAAMPTDLRSGNGIRLANIFGNASRFNITAPKCVLTTAVKPDQRQVAFRADCHSIAGQTVAAAINKVLATGTRISFAIDGAGAKCSALTPIENTAPGMTAILQVEDATCLTLSSNAAVPAPAGSHILLPRFVAYEAVHPDQFHTSFIETGADRASGLTLTMPDFLTKVGDTINPVSPIDLSNGAGCLATRM